MIEVLVALAVVGFLAALILPNLTKVGLTASKAKCVNNMRGIHGALASYMNDHGSWPQQPDFQPESTELFEDWWIAKLMPYTQTDRIWRCPIMEGAKIKNPEGRPLRVHYIPSRFDARPFSPFRWSRQPWLVEMNDAHGSGALVAFPDGSIRSMREVLVEAGVSLEDK